MAVLDIIQLLLLFPVVMVSTLYPDRLDMKMSIVVISPVVIFTLFLLLKYQVSDLLLMPQVISKGLIAGIILFVLSIWLTEKNKLLSALNSYKKNIRLSFQKEYRQYWDWKSVLFISFMVIYEEIIWRVFLVGTLSLYFHVSLVVLIASFLFYYSHADQRKLNLASLDLLIFSLILTVVYYYSRSFFLVVIIHWIRNIIIIANSVGSIEIENSTVVAIDNE